MKNSPLVIGITGGIGSGKTTICRIFEILGARTYYADDRAKWLMGHEPDLIKEIKLLFGDGAYRHDLLDRKCIAKQAFADKSLLEKLNRVVHPAVNKDANQWIKENQDAPLLLKEAALLFETGSYTSLDRNILVTSPEEIRMKRVLKRDTHRSEIDVKNIMKNQMSDEEKKPLADFIITNDETQSVIKQVMELYQQLIIT